MNKKGIKILQSLTVLLFSFLLFSGCYQQKKITLATSFKGSAAERIGNEIAAYLKHSGWEVEVLSGPEHNGSNNINLLEQGLVDFAFVSNDLEHTAKAKNIQTVLPVYPNLNFILYKSSLHPVDLDDLISNNSVVIYEDDESFYMNLFEYYGLKTQTLTYDKFYADQSIEEIMQEIQSGKNDVICISAAVQNEHIKFLINNGWEIFSLGDINLSKRGSSVDGFCMQYPRTEPFIIPKNFYGKKPVYPVYTVSLFELIVTSRTADKHMIYDLTEDIYGGRHFLSQQEVLLTYVNESFNRDALNFQLHEGAIDYLERNKPTLFERYSNVLGLVISIIVVLAGAFTSLKQIRKERIDKYYKRVTDCRDINELNTISDEAITQLEKEKLNANESFLIFLKLIEKKREKLNNPAEN